MRSGSRSTQHSIRFAALRVALVLAVASGCARPAAEDAPRADPRLERAERQANRWEESIREFEEADAERPPPKNAVLFVGSSSIRMWDLDESFPRVETLNRGFGGSQISDVLRYVSRIVIPYEPRVIVFYAGDNDLAAGKSAERVLRDFDAFVRAVHAALPRTRVVFVAIKPSIARWNLVKEMRRANRLVEGLTMTDERLEFVDVDTPMIGGNGQPRVELFAEDGLHLNARGYELWTRLVEPYLE